MDQRSEIAILGFGKEGRSMLTWLMEHKYPNVTICDKNVDLKQELPDGVSARLGESYLDELKDFDVIFRSPGVRFLTPQVQLAIKNGAEVNSVVQFFLDQCPCPVIGITGTKGKGTTATLIYEILKKAKKKIFLGGNIGTPPVEFLDKIKGDDLVVLELSSFQMQDVKHSPQYAVLLNTTIDHLDYHADEDEYLRAKEGILSHQNKQDVAVLNKDYPYGRYYEPLIKGELKYVSRDEELKDGAYVKDDAIYYSEDGKAEKIIDVGEIGLIGSHNLENVMPAVVIAKELGVRNSIIADVVANFKGLPHRLEFVREFKGVRYYNDSFSTNTQTSMAAVDSFDEPTVLIAGGYDKGLDYKEWAVKILTKENLKVVILIGDTADMMEDALREAEKTLGEAEGSPTKIIRRGDLEEAVLEAYAESSDGWVVVMSPAAASFDMFKDYKERGKKFAEAVEGLK